MVNKNNENPNLLSGIGNEFQALEYIKQSINNYLKLIDELFGDGNSASVLNRKYSNLGSGIKSPLDG